MPSGLEMKEIDIRDDKLKIKRYSGDQTKSLSQAFEIEKSTIMTLGAEVFK